MTPREMERRLLEISARYTGRDGAETVLRATDPDERAALREEYRALWEKWRPPQAA